MKHKSRLHYLKSCLMTRKTCIRSCGKEDIFLFPGAKKWSFLSITWLVHLDASEVTECSLYPSSFPFLSFCFTHQVFISILTFHWAKFSFLFYFLIAYYLVHIGTGIQNLVYFVNLCYIVAIHRCNSFDNYTFFNELLVLASNAKWHWV